MITENNKLKIGFIGQGWIGKNYADDFESRKFDVVRYSLESQYSNNKDLIKECDIVFIAVPTPTISSGVDVSNIKSVLPLIKEKGIVVIKSTISPGTTKNLQKDYKNIFILHSPEFLVEATAAHDASHPDRNIVGVPFWSEEHRKAAELVMSVLPESPYELICDSNESEIIKYSHNIHGYFQVVFSNMLYDLVTNMGSSWSSVKNAILNDPMMSHYYLDPFHKNGRGAGGDCFIKDFEAFINIYENATGDTDGTSALRFLERKNTKLLLGSNKDIGILKGVYGEKIKSPGILIITQKLDKDDSYFGFFHKWVEMFSAFCVNVTVLSLEVGNHDLPKNVSVISLGKEKGRSAFKYLYRYYSTILKYRKSYDMVFCHMSPWYVILGAPIFKILNKKISLWYTHKHVDLKLKIATLLSDTIFTATKESFRIKTKKAKYLGQAVVVEDFKNNFSNSDTGETLKIITVGRITRIKNLDLLIKAVGELVNKNINVEVDIVGAPITSDDLIYEKELLKLVDEKNIKNHINFVGAVAHKDLPAWYSKNNVAVNMCPTGGMDKAVLEAMAASLPTVLSNEAFGDYFGPYIDNLLFDDKNIDDFVDKLIYLKEFKNRHEIGEFLFKEVERRSSLRYLIGKIVYNLVSL